MVSTIVDSYTMGCATTAMWDLRRKPWVENEKEEK